MYEEVFVAEIREGTKERTCCGAESHHKNSKAHMRFQPNHPTKFGIPAPSKSSNDSETDQGGKKRSEMVYAPGVSYQSDYPIARAIRIVANNPIKQNSMAELAAC